MDERELLVLADTFGLEADCVAAIRRLALRPTEAPVRDTVPMGVTFGRSVGFPGEPTLVEITPHLLPERYEDQGLIGRGGMGEVRRVRDRCLNRVLAMKIMLPGSGEIDRARFLEEAQIAAQLQHPGLVPVHDFGDLADGRFWFTMLEVRGRTLDQVIAEVHGAVVDRTWHPTPDGWTFRRLIDVYQRACEAVAYAHSRAVVHRDLKPSNLMVGEFGQVFVMDWGLAKTVGGADDPVHSSARETGDLQATRHGRVMGTLAYMPPEQARGNVEGIGPHSDVYSLGAVLYHLLAGRAPLTGTTTWGQLMDGPPPLHEALGEETPDPPPELVELCTQAMARDPADRPPHAGVLAEAVAAWLDGSGKRERALDVVERARAMEPVLAAGRAAVEALRDRAAAVLGPVPEHAPATEKAVGWRLEDEATEREHALRRGEAELEQTLRSALAIEPQLPEAHERLADLYRRRLDEAEAARDAPAALRWEALLRAHDDGRHALYLAGDGAVSLRTDPPGARVDLLRYERRDRRLVPVPVGTLGTTPLERAPLPRGSYLLRLTRRGCAPVDYPVHIERQTHWDGRDPTGQPQALRLPRASELGPDDVYVPAGWFWSGGDPLAADALPRRRAWVDGFVIRRHPVTNRELLEFLNDADPSLSDLGPGVQTGEAVFRRGDDGRWTLVEGERIADWPAVRVDWRTAMAYAEWLAARTGRPWRLPHELEREKAARGVDGRFFPWGDQPETTWACVINSRPEPPKRVPVDTPLGDVSPYGVCGLAGNARDMCLNAYRRDGPPLLDGRIVIAAPPADDEGYRSVRGGAWASTIALGRLAGRFAVLPHQRFDNVGFRLARAL
jgi:serine/threonine-protein kinase